MWDRLRSMVIVGPSRGPSWDLVEVNQVEGDESHESALPSKRITSGYGYTLDPAAVFGRSHQLIHTLSLVSFFFPPLSFTFPFFINFTFDR